MKSVPNFEVMKHYLLQIGFSYRRGEGMFILHGESGLADDTQLFFISDEEEESTRLTENAIKILADDANISERGMISRIIKSWTATHLMRPTK